MTLADTYLEYPRRAYGSDQDRYAWKAARERTPAAAWPGDRALACLVVVPIEHHMLDPAGKPFRHPGAMVTPYPDLRHYSSRDYGNRIGVFRILSALAAAGVRATVPVNAMQLDRLRPLVDAVLADGHEIAAYGLSTDHIHWSGLAPGVERAWVDEVRARFDAAGLAPRAWMSPARQQSFETLDLIAADGFDICLDWESDEVPLPMATAGGPVLALPLSSELDDRTLLIDRRQPEDSWADQVIEARDMMVAACGPGSVLGFTLTPYVAGQPFRQTALRRMLAAIGDGQAWSAGATDIAMQLAGHERA